MSHRRGDGDRPPAAGALLRGQKIGLTGEDARRVAAIDVGSNATRLTVLEVDAAGRERGRTAHRYPLRLGGDVFAHGEVGATLAEALVDTFAAMARLLDAEGVTTYRAVATSALREAQNGAALVRRIADASGLALEIIGGAEESRLGHAALLRAVGGLRADAMLIDLGGGSLELTRPRSRRGRSLPLGSLRLLARWPALSGPLSGPEVARARAFVDGWVARHLGRVAPAHLGVGIGGTLEVLAGMVGDATAGAPRFAVSALTPLVEAMAGMSPMERATLHKVGPDRADLVLPAALIVLALGRALGLDTLVVPGVSLREGLLVGLLTPASPGEAARRLLGQNEHGALARRSAHLAQELFADLAAVHRLWPPALAPLLAAVHAWYFGAHLGPTDAEAHAAYLLSQVTSLDLPPTARRAALFALSTLRPGARPAWPPRALTWRPFVDGAPAPPAERGARADDEEDGARAAWALAGVLRLALTLGPMARRTTALSVDVLADPVRIEADLSLPLTQAVLAPLTHALGRRIEVR